MAAFLSDQLDFIFFFYGLAFILLGAMCWAIARRRTDERYWKMLAAFGLIHGVGEWLDLSALILGDSVAFSTLRISVMTVSFSFWRNSAECRWPVGAGPLGGGSICLLSA